MQNDYFSSHIKKMQSQKRMESPGSWKRLKYVEDLSHNPKINQRSSCLPRSLSDLYKWQDTKQTKQQMLRRYFEMETTATKEPLCYTNEISNEILKFTRKQNTPIEDILLQKGYERDNKIREYEHKLYGAEQVPKITKKGHSLLRNQTVYERLYGLSLPKKQETPTLLTQKSCLDLNSKRSNQSHSLFPKQQQLSLGQKLLMKFKSAQGRDSTYECDRSQSSVPQRNQTLSERINAPRKSSQRGVETPNLKECYFSLLDVKQREKPNKQISPQQNKENIDQQRIGLKLNSITSKRNEVGQKIYKYILEKD